MPTSATWFPAGPVPGSTPPTELDAYLRRGSQWYPYLYAFLAAQPQAGDLTGGLEWLAANREFFEAAKPSLAHPRRSMAHQHRETRHQYHRVLDHVRAFVPRFVHEYLRQTGALGARAGAVGFRAAREEDGVPPLQVAEAIYETAQRMTLWGAELTDLGIRFTRVFGRGDGSGALSVHDAFLTACTESRLAVIAWRDEDSIENRHRVDDAFASMCRADAEFARAAEKWLRKVHAELRKRARKLERDGLAALHADLQKVRLLGESVRAVLVTASAVLAFTPAASVSVVLSGVSGLLTVIDWVAVEVTVRNSTATDEQILDHTGLHVEHDRRVDLNDDIPTAPVTVAAAGAAGVRMAGDLVPGGAVRAVLDVAGGVSGAVTGFTGPVGAVVGVANTAIHAYGVRHPPRIVHDGDSAEKRHTAEEVLRQNRAMGDGGHPAMARRSPDEQVWVNALSANRAAQAWLETSGGARLQNPLTLPYESVTFLGETVNRFSYEGSLLCDVGGSPHELAASWTITPEGVLQIDDETWAAAAHAAGAQEPDPAGGRRQGEAGESSFVDFAARAHDDDFMDHGAEAGWFADGRVNDHYPWPTARAYEAVRERLHDLLLANDCPEAPYFGWFVHYVDLPVLSERGRSKCWLDNDGRPDPAYPRWTHDSQGMLEERLRTGR
ncbi:hypothetical protein [Streptomyces sp. NPDC093223]|uniref:hypothetical protein n=1 Tax=Streptomyces sp. NPDC093223 TaxID=3366033 RepID=UPI00380F88BE